MKKGKTSKLVGYKSSKINYGTVDSNILNHFTLTYNLGQNQMMIMTIGQGLS